MSPLSARLLIVLFFALPASIEACGAKKADKTFGAAIVMDVVVKE